MLWLVDESGGESHLRRFSRTWSPTKACGVSRADQIRLGDDARLTLSTSSAVCCVTRHMGVIYILWPLTETMSRTINDPCDLVIDRLHPFFSTDHSIADASHLTVDGGHPVVDTSHSVIDITRGFENLSSSHPSLLIGQRVQPLQRIFDIRLSCQLLEKPL